MKKLAGRNTICKSILTHTHVLQIIDDHQYMWLMAETDAEKRSIKRRLRKQLALAGVSFGGFEMFIHGAVLAPADPQLGAGLLLVGVLVMYLTGGRGHQ
ncbi:hypothetical protein [uncultured Hydrogenophaga sp.]|uniref:hypothetical protein n=1 Tax=uncultured Hydrogenophaga sp. TaxID=199683 RepID=UPI002590D4A5|nr:hypothetical protein [uncultured Hydrogenophaga sp.]